MNALLFKNRLKNLKKKLPLAKKTNVMTVIEENVLFDYGATTSNYITGEVIFSENTICQYYYQIIKGTVKLTNFSEKGKEFVHGFPFSGHCFGESYLFTTKKYAFNAIAYSPCEIIKLPKDAFALMIEKHPNLSAKVNHYTADRLHFRYIISSLMIVSNPCERLIKLLDYLKEYFGFKEKFSFLVPFTRAQLSALIGLRVETVIRTLKKMHTNNIVKIERSKIYY